MSPGQKVIKYFAAALAALLAAGILGSLLGAVGLFGGLFFQSAPGELQSYTVSGPVAVLELELRAASLTVVTGDQFLVESNLPRLSVSEEDGVLRIQEKGGFGVHTAGAALTLSIPAGTVLDRAELSTGAGTVTVEALSARDLELELGAGEVTIGELNALDRASVEGGAGQITISGGALRNLELDMGVGRLALTAALTGENRLRLGIGESRLTLLGSRADYRVEAEKGLGGLTLDGESASSGTVGSGPNRVRIQGGIGQIRLTLPET